MVGKWLTMLKKIITWWLINRIKAINLINRHLLKKSFAAAKAAAKKEYEATGKKMWVVLVNGDFEAIPKKDFKEVWNRTPGMKFRSIAEWKKRVYEFDPNREQNNSGT